MDPRIMRRFALILALIASPAAAQQVTSAAGGTIRVLDKLNGEVADVDMRNGQAMQIGLLVVQMNDCRFPSGNPTGNAYAHLDVRYRDNPDPTFSGWMVASAPALNAMDHPRYDVWVMRCAQ